ncbi:hypothetical protein [Thermaurantimonas sp.]|uniref:hypothetical protein n=1 Tax=Thermaurantimonas sp. TaxID=2681568 RepID=UPI00391AAA40
MILFPAEGFKFFGIKVHFAQISDFLPQKSTKTKENVVLTNNISDSLWLQDREMPKSSVYQKRKILNYIGEISPLAPFYDALHSNKEEKIRIFHFGDSQIENDRISSFLRERWQAMYGGGGMGYLPANAWVPHLSAEHRNSPNWMRYTAFGTPNAEITHRRFGPYLSFARFTPVDTAECTEEVNAWIEVSASKKGFSRSRKYSLLKILLGNNYRPFELTVLENGSVLKKEKILALPEKDTLLTIKLQSTGSQIRIEFLARHSPDVYGLSLEQDVGIVLDNVPMRGADGTTFSRCDASQISRYMQRENTGLIIMQFGGNALPYLRDNEHAGKAAQNIARQIQLLKRLSGDAPVLFIGPSDMAIKVKDQFVTHPLLSDFRDSLLHHVTLAGAAYYDLLEAMGGEGSMVEWVQAQPPLATTDYIHFTPAGARLAAERLFDELEKDLKAHLYKHHPAHEKNQEKTQASASP